MTIDRTTTGTARMRKRRRKRESDNVFYVAPLLSHWPAG
jgi:hypothetical protein